MLTGFGQTEETRTPASAWEPHVLSEGETSTETEAGAEVSDVPPSPGF